MLSFRTQSDHVSKMKPMRPYQHPQAFLFGVKDNPT
jgi:hypothetical protein